MVSEKDEKKFGFEIEEVTETLVLDTNEFQDVGSSIAHLQSSLVKHTSIVDGKVILILDLETVFKKAA